MNSSVSPEFYWIAVAVVTILSASRLTRLATFDKFPPVKWLRDKYEDKTDGTGWQWLAMCGYCFSFWATLFVVAWAYMSGVIADPLSPVGDSLVPFTIWWLVNSTLAASYAAAVFMAFDGDDSEDDSEDDS